MRRLLLLGFAVLLPLLVLGEGLRPASATAGTVDTWSGTVDISYNAVLDSASQSYTETIVETIGIELGGPGLDGVVRRSDPDFVIYHQGFEYQRKYKSHIVSKKPTCPDNFVRESEAFGTVATRAPEEGGGPFIVDIDRTFASPAGLEFHATTGRFETILHEFGTVGCGAWTGLTSTRKSSALPSVASPVPITRLSTTRQRRAARSLGTFRMKDKTKRPR